MNKLKKFVFIVLILISPIYVGAAGVSDVDYDIEDVYISAEIDILGSVHVTEGIVIKGSLNGFEREIDYMNPALKSYTSGSEIDFSNSAIYNARAMSLSKVTAFKIDKDKIGYSMFSPFLEAFSEEDTGSAGDSGIYTLKSLSNGIKVRTYYPNTSGYVVYYFEYYLDQPVVLHNDVAEFYWQFIPKDFDYIKRAHIQVTAPGTSSSDTFRVWAHGPLNGSVSMIESDTKGLYNGLYADVEDINGTGVDVRMTFDTRLMSTASSILTKTNVDALDKIIEVETKRADDANRTRTIAKSIMYGIYVLTGAYFVGLIVLWIYVYRKYDKEYRVDFEAKYYREFTGDYGVEVVDYLMKKNVTTNAMSASILNLIYKKNIEVIDNTNDKKDPIFKLLNRNNLSKSEEIIMDIMFDLVGKDGEVTMKQIEKYSSKYSTADKFMKKYNSWVEEVKTEGEKEEFFEDNSGKRAASCLYLLMGIIIIGAMYVSNMVMPLIMILIIASAIAFVIYVATFKKWTKKGREHYLKWEAFKNFLNDFGSFKEKELPEVKLWEKYLVYATVFGLAKKVQETMKVKLREFGYNDDYYTNGWFYRDYYIGNSIENSIRKTYARSQSEINRATAGSSSSSGGGFGGGFSSGGGFGGGSGSGHGF